MKIIKDGDKRLILYESLEQIYSTCVMFRSMLFDIEDSKEYPKVISIEVRNPTDSDRRVLNYGKKC